MNNQHKHLITQEPLESSSYEAFSAIETPLKKSFPVVLKDQLVSKHLPREVLTNGVTSQNEVRVELGAINYEANLGFSATSNNEVVSSTSDPVVALLKNALAEPNIKQKLMELLMPRNDAVPAAPITQSLISPDHVTCQNIKTTDIEGGNCDSGSVGSGFQRSNSGSFNPMKSSSASYLSSSECGNEPQKFILQKSKSVFVSSNLQRSNSDSLLSLSTAQSSSMMRSHSGSDGGIQKLVSTPSKRTVSSLTHQTPPTPTLHTIPSLPSSTSGKMFRSSTGTLYSPRISVSNAGNNCIHSSPPGILSRRADALFDLQKYMSEQENTAVGTAGQQLTSTSINSTDYHVLMLPDEGVSEERSLILENTSEQTM